MRVRRCVMERPSPNNGGIPVWHIVPSGDDGNDTWSPIACSTRFGIVMPGPITVREPTCPDCIAGRTG